MIFFISIGIILVSFFSSAYRFSSTIPFHAILSGIAVNVNTAYLGQLFRTQTGKYFNDYLTDARLETACSLLTDSSFHIRKIAQMVGIPNQSYFNRVFKKKFMLTPMEYHQRYAEIREKN